MVPGKRSPSGSAAYLFMHMLRLHFRAHLMEARGITDLKSALQNIFAENIVEKKEDFLQTFSTECDYVKIVSKGEILQQNTTNAHNSDSNSYLKTDCSDLEVIWVVVGTMPVGHLYSRLVPLVLILVDGSNPIDIIDPRCEILLIVQNKIDLQGVNQLRLLGFAAIYRFTITPTVCACGLVRYFYCLLTSAKVTAVIF